MRRVQEACAGVQRRPGWRFLGFLDERGRTLAEACLHKQTAVAAFWGGFAGAQRCLLGLGGDCPPQEADFPLCAVQIACQLPPHAGAVAPCTHRDYLGALLGLGLERECIGDILTRADGAVCFVLERTAPVILQELTSVGRCIVRCTSTKALQLADWQPQTEQVRINVPSLRLDAVLAALLHTSRAKAAELISRGAVSLCHVPVSQPHTAVQPQDTISVRGSGRFLIEDVDGQSKKGRLWLSARRYVG